MYAPLLAVALFTAQLPDFDKVTIKVVPVAGSIYMLQGSGGNIGVSVGEDGIVIVDDQFAPLAPKIRAALKGIADKPVRFVLNTHWHPDHTGGNEAIGREATIIAHENVRKRLVSGAPARKVGNEDRPPTPPAVKGALPAITFDQTLTVHLNGEDIRAVHFPSGHTDGDSVIWFTKSNVVHMGDDFVTYGYPFIDYGSGGSLKGLIGHLEKIIPQLPANAKIIPGHGDLSTVEDLKKFAANLKEIVGIVEGEIKKGKKLEEIKKAKPLAKWDATWGQGFLKADGFIEMIHTEVTAKR